MDSLFMQEWRVLALSPHTDDVELGAGGTLARLARLGTRITYIAFARAEASKDEDSLEECRLSLRMLGIEDLQFWDFPVRRFSDFRQDILDRLIQLRNAMQIDLVLVPARPDCHQDHQLVTMEAIRAFKKARLLGYDLPWNAVGESRLDFFVPLSESDIEQKERALACYKGQIGRSFFEPGTIQAIARFRGEQCGEQYAEGFECIRWKL